MPTEIPENPSSNPLTPRQQADFAEARKRFDSFGKAGKVAAFNGWSFILLGAMCLPLVVFSVLSGIVGAVLIAIGAVELHGRNRLLRGEPAAGKLLAVNQLVLLTLVGVYCAWQIYAHQSGPSELKEYEAELRQLNIDLESMYRLMTWLVYSAVFAASAVYQGLCALRYMRTARAMRRFADETEPWIKQMLGLG